LLNADSPGRTGKIGAMPLKPTDGDIEMDLKLRHLQQMYDDVRAVAQIVERRHKDVWVPHADRRRNDISVTAES
jgi:hypothetical protein